MEKQKRIAAIHDISCVGRCSLTVALPILSAAGLDTGVLPTAVLSTHTGEFSGFTYRDLTSELRPISQHWQSLGLRFDALYSGFLGSFAQIDLVAELFATFKTDQTLIMVDPVMGDNGQLYSVYSPEMAKGMTRLCAGADLIVPNFTEAALMLDQPYHPGPYTQPQVETMLLKLAALGPRQVVLTGVWFSPDRLGASALDQTTGQISYAWNKRVPGQFHGTGDVFGSALLAGLMNGFTLPEALQIAVDFTHQCVEMTLAAKQERRYGVCFERALPFLMGRLGLLQARH